jgi:hypothetical protein
MIYIYTVRDIKNDNEFYFPYLIPKVSDFWSNSFEPPTKDVKRIIELLNKLPNDDLLIKNLFNPGLINTLLEKTTYINNSDKAKIIKLNKLEIKKIMRLKDFEYLLLPNQKKEKIDTLKIRLIKHLLQGHQDMKYGIYFSLLHAKDDADFISKFEKMSHESDIKTIYFTQLNKLLQYVTEKDEEYKFENDTKLVYMNENWNSGFITDKSILLERGKNNKLDIQKFCDELKDIEFGDQELICQLPLPIELFSFFFVNDSSPKFLAKSKVKKSKVKKVKKSNCNVKNLINSTISYKRRIKIIDNIWRSI